MPGTAKLLPRRLSSEAALKGGITGILVRSGQRSRLRRSTRGEAAGLSPSVPRPDRAMAMRAATESVPRKGGSDVAPRRLCGVGSMLVGAPIRIKSFSKVAVSICRRKPRKCPEAKSADPGGQLRFARLAYKQPQRA